MSNIDERTGKPKIILDLCGGTGSWSRYYSLAGYDVRNITLPDFDVLTYEPPENVYGILAAPPLHGVFGIELQSGGEGKKPGGGAKGGYGLYSHYSEVQPKMVGYGKPGRLSARVHGKAYYDIPAVGVRRPVDKAHRHLGDVHPAGETVRSLGRCSGETTALHPPRQRKAEFCIPAQVGTRANSTTRFCEPTNGRRISGNNTARICRGFL